MAHVICHENGVDIKLKVVFEHPGQTAGDGGGDGVLRSDTGELLAVDAKGKQEIERTPNKTGLKLNFVKDCWEEKTGNDGWCYTNSPVICVEGGGMGTDETARTIVHELVAHAMGGDLKNTGSIGEDGHSSGKDDVTNSTGSGRLIPAVFKREIEKKRGEFCKCATQFDRIYPSQKEQAQRGRNTDAPFDHLDPNDGAGELASAYLDLSTTRLTSLDSQLTIDAVLSLYGSFSGAVDATYYMAFDVDNDADTGALQEPFGGSEFTVELYVTGSDGNYAVSGLVRNRLDGTTVALPQLPIIFTSNISGGPPDLARDEIWLEIPKPLIGLETNLDGALTDVPVSVFSVVTVDGVPVFADSNYFDLRMDQWLRDPVFETFENGVPAPGEPYRLALSGLKPFDEYDLYLDDTLVFSGALGAAGDATAEFVFPEGMSNLEAHFLTAQDTTGEFAYGMTCPESGACCYLGRCVDGAMAATCRQPGATFYPKQKCRDVEPCPESETGACCDTATGVCIDEVEPEACHGTFTAGVLCAEVECDPPRLTGACCFPSGECFETDPFICRGDDGRYAGDGVKCSGDRNGNGLDDLCEDICDYPFHVDCPDYLEVNVDHECQWQVDHYTLAANCTSRDVDSLDCSATENAGHGFSVRGSWVVCDNRDCDQSDHSFTAIVPRDYLVPTIEVVRTAQVELGERRLSPWFHADDVCEIMWRDNCTDDYALRHGVVNVRSSDPTEVIQGEPGAFYSDGINTDWYGFNLNLDGLGHRFGQAHKFDFLLRWLQSPFFTQSRSGFAPTGVGARLRCGVGVEHGCCRALQRGQAVQIKFLACRSRQNTGRGTRNVISPASPQWSANRGRM